MVATGAHERGPSAGGRPCRTLDSRRGGCGFSTFNEEIEFTEDIGFT